MEKPFRSFLLEIAGLRDCLRLSNLYEDPDHQAERSRLIWYRCDLVDWNFISEVCELSY